MSAYVCLKGEGRGGRDWAGPRGGRCDKGVRPHMRYGASYLGRIAMDLSDGLGTTKFSTRRQKIIIELFE